MKKQKVNSVMVVTDRLLGFSKEVPSVVDPRYPVDYSKLETPPNYKCGKCGATGCKLWREYQTFLEHQMLLCAKCAAKSQKKYIGDIDARGTRSVEEGSDERTCQIGWFVPAVPTEQNDTYWGLTSIPPGGVEWWMNLPTLPGTASPS